MRIGSIFCHFEIDNTLLDEDYHEVDDNQKYLQTKQ